MTSRKSAWSSKRRTLSGGTSPRGGGSVFGAGGLSGERSSVWDVGLTVMPGVRGKMRGGITPEQWKLATCARRRMTRHWAFQGLRASRSFLRGVSFSILSKQHECQPRGIAFEAPTANFLRNQSPPGQTLRSSARSQPASVPEKPNVSSY